MSTEIEQKNGMDQTTVESVLLNGDLSKLTVPQRLSYYKSVCESLGLNPLTKPFGYIVLNNKLTLYAMKDCTDQLRKNHGVSITGLSMKIEDGLAIATATGRDKDGRTDAATGAVDVKSLTGERKANALMKAETKAKRRLTLSLCGLGVIDESETSSVEGAKIVPEDAQVDLKTTETAPAPSAPTSTTPTAKTPSQEPAEGQNEQETNTVVTTTDRVSEIKSEMDVIYNDPNLGPPEKRKALNGKMKGWLVAKEGTPEVMEYYNSVIDAIKALERGK